MEVRAFQPAYVALLDSGELEHRAHKARAALWACRLCPHACGVDRTWTITGAVCRTGAQAVVCSFGPHHGEEDCLRGARGSGTIFFGGCNMRCVFCQNADISQGLRPKHPHEHGHAFDDGPDSCGLAERVHGVAVSTERLARIMLDLQGQGCHNVNLVSPSHVVSQVVQAVALAAAQGLRLPIVYNTGGYDSLEALHLLDGIVDVYMPDMKYADGLLARRYSKVRDYVTVNRAAVKEMYRQVGNLVLDHQGLAVRGLLVRHLVLPGNVSGTEQVMAFLAREVSPDVHVNLMDQYHPWWHADRYPPLDRRPSEAEFRAAYQAAERFGLKRVDGHGWCHFA